MLQLAAVWSSDSIVTGA